MPQVIFELQRAGSMEENLRIVPDFWKTVLQGNQFWEICRLSNGELRGILGISVYKNSKEIYDG